MAIATSACKGIFEVTARRLKLETRTAIRPSSFSCTGAAFPADANQARNKRNVPPLTSTGLGDKVARLRRDSGFMSVE